MLKKCQLIGQICSCFFGIPTLLVANVATVLNDTCIVLEISRSIASSDDDAEEYPDGSMYLTSSDLELVEETGTGIQTVGLRFPNLLLPQGVEIQEAYLQFTTDDEYSTGFANLNIAAEASGNALPFEETAFNLSNRIASNTQISWLPGGWLNAGERGGQQKTPDLKNLVQQTVNQPNWEAGNAMAFLFSGTGQRIAAAYDLDPNRAAELVIKIAHPTADTLLQNVFLNEIMAANTETLDEFGEADDWLEIYNGDDEPLFLGGLYLTDDLDDLQKWQMTSSPLIPAHGFLQIWADNQPEQGGAHAAFKLKSGGEFLAIVQELDGELHILDSLTFPEIPQNITYGRLEDGQNEWVFFSEISPNFSNNGQAQLLNETVVFSENSGFFSDEIMVEMSVADAEADIYYTVDDSVPTTQDLLYQSPVLVAETTNLQAKAFKPGFVSTAITSAFFVIDEASELPVLNVQSDPDNFWNDQTGIYVHGTNGSLEYCDNVLNNWNRDWERPCQLTFLEADGTQGFQVNAGMKIGGACSKNLKMKSLNFFLRSNDYGDELIDYPLFPNSDISEFRRFKARNGGTDWIEMLFRDGMNSLILANTVDIDLLAYRPTRLYLNGEYWGIHGIREMFNKYYVESHHGSDPDNLDILGDPYGPGSHVREGDFVRYDEMMDFLNGNSLFSSSNYATIQEFLDLQEYLNYHITQIYLANYDWPGNNVRIWRDRNNGKFRWMFFDTDASTGWQDWGNEVAAANHNTLAHTLNTEPIGSVPGFPQWPNGPESTFLFRKMMENDDFKNEFIQRTCTFRELIFAPERVLPMVDSMENLLLPEMQRHINHWQGNDDLGSGTPSGGSVGEWENYVDNFRSFYNNRQFFILSILQNTLNLDGRFNLTFGYDADTNGEVVLHENEMPIPFHYEGEYFKNVPLKVKAIPHPGYYFSHWLETGETSAEIAFVGSADGVLTPIFTDQPVHVSQQKLANLVKVFPNPAHEYLTIHWEDAALNFDQILLFSSIGQAVLNQKISSQLSAKISVSHLPKGVYWLMFLNDGNKWGGQRVVID